MKRLPLLYAVLFSAYPVLFLYSHNNGYLSINELFLPLAITLLGATLLLGLLRLISRNSDIAAALTAFWGLWFLSYGHLLNVDTIMQDSPTEFIVTHALWLWLAIFVLGTLVILRLRHRLLGARTALFVIAAVLVGITSWRIAGFEWQRMHTAAPQAASPAAMAVKNPAPAQTPSINPAHSGNTSHYPDIYYIILDGYARPDVFQELYGESNGRFINFLETKGFIIAKDSRANYFKTMYSLASSLNMCYLNELAPKTGTESWDEKQAWVMVKKNALYNLLWQKGYKIIAGGAEVKPNAQLDVDNMQEKGRSQSIKPMPDFKWVVLEMTPLLDFSHFFDLSRQVQSERDHDKYDLYRSNILKGFDMILTVPESKYPRFVFALLSSTHPPFVFYRNGAPIRQTRPLSFNDGVKGLSLNVNETQASFLKHYPEQYLFVSAKLQQTLEMLLAKKSSRPKVIILQSDHGPACYFNWYDPPKSYVRERISIMNAFYFSDGARPLIYDSMTPVNTFRIISNQYFQTDFPLLKDRSYLPNKGGNGFLDVTDRMGKLPADKLPKPPQ